MNITVTSTVNNGGTWYDVTIGGVTIIGCQRKQGTGAKGPYDFISLPQRAYTTSGGAKKYAPIVKLDKETEDAVRAAIKAHDAGEGDTSGVDGYPPEETTDLEPF
jgi:hypothetical protein